jgi:hypothetical protein
MDLAYTSYKEIQEGLSWMIGYRKERYSKHQIENAMKYLTKHAMIATERTTRGLLVTICNYEIYQNPNNYEHHNESLTVATTAPQGGESIYKNDKNDKNERMKELNTTPLRVDFSNFKPSLQGILHHYEAVTGNVVESSEIPIVENMLTCVFPAQLITAITKMYEGKYSAQFKKEGLAYLEQPILNGAYGSKNKKDYRPKAKRDKYEKRTKVYN